MGEERESSSREERLRSRIEADSVGGRGAMIDEMNSSFEIE